MNETTDKEGMSFDATAEDGNILVKVGGRISAIEATPFQSQLDDLIPKPEKGILLDCAGLEYISSSGLRVILRFAKQASSNDKKLAIFALKREVGKIFEISGFSRILDIFPDKDKARAFTAG